MDKNLKLIIFYNFIFSLVVSLTTGNFPQYVILLGGDLTSWGIIASIAVIIDIITIVPANYIADLLGHQKVINLIIIIAFLGSLFTFLAPTWQWLLFGYVALELEQGVFMPVAIAIMTLNTLDTTIPGKNTERVLIFTYFSLANVLGGSVGYVISAIYFIFVGNIYTKNLLRGNMFLTVVLSLLIVIISFIFRASSDKSRRKLKGINEEKNLSNKKSKLTSQELFVIIGFTVSSFCIGLGAGFFIPFAQPFWYDVFHLSPAAINIILGVSFLCISIGMLLIPVLTKKLSRTQIILLSQGIAIPLTLIIAWVNILYLVIIAYLGRFTLMNMSTPVQNTLVQRGLNDTYRATGFSITQLANRLGRGLTPTFASLIILDLGFAVSFTLTAIFYAVAIIAVFMTITLYHLDPQQKSFTNPAPNT